ncbi:MAG TPA: prepilin-type N-terminal cleavage/methylation domain-containing protein [Candidatus Acidoferrum sp.]|nr:prepilin-type N-terminal cleavage/methylation domain-containing protein [Candidatus Acidoferrum sp.]
MTEQKGFSLIELLIVVAIILIISAIAVPAFVRSKIAANEASAVASLNAINVSETTYNNTYPGTYATLAQLGPGGATCGVADPANACLIDNILANASSAATAKSGYYFTIGGDLVTGYASLAQPATPNTTGTRTFCSDQTLVLFYDAAGGACTTTTGSPL